ncbi:MAG: peptidylprolyl isomerase [Bryobacterales bacterium]|nr:peptidylprolyl isomerase [Bryobacterales bacterium]
MFETRRRILSASLSAAIAFGWAGCSPAPREKAAEPVPPAVEEVKPEPAPDVYRAKFSSSKGDFVIEVNRKWAPLAADRFYALLKDDYYPGAPVYRVQPGFVVQWGISNSTRKSAKWNQEYLEDEPRTQSNTRGTVAFATSGPGSRTMQVFVNMGNNTPLNAQGFTPFGRVVSGMDVLSKMKSYGDDIDQGRLMREGGTYVEMFFPKMDRIEKAELLPAP